MRSGSFSIPVAWLSLAALGGCGARESPVERPGATPAPTTTAPVVRESSSALEAKPALDAGAVAKAPDAAPPREARPAFEARQPRWEVVRAMLELAGVSKDEIAYLLGCGDGGLAVGVARDREARVIAIDSSPEAISVARENVRKAGVEGLVEFRQEDATVTRIADAHVLFILLAPSLQKKIERRLLTDLKPGSRVVSWVPAMTTLSGEDDESGTLYLYVVPARSHPESLAPYVQTPLPVVQKMFEMARLTKDDVLYDLGCGDGRIVVEAAKRYGARGVGIDFDSRRIEEARARARREGVERLVEFRQEDILKADLSGATVVTLFLLPDTNKLLKPKLGALRPGTRILSHQFPTEGWTPVAKETMTLPDTGLHTIYLWEVRPDMTPVSPKAPK